MESKAILEGSLNSFFWMLLYNGDDPWCSCEATKIDWCCYFAGDYSVNLGISNSLRFSIYSAWGSNSLNTSNVLNLFDSSKSNNPIIMLISYWLYFSLLSLSSFQYVNFFNSFISYCNFYALNSNFFTLYSSSIYFNKHVCKSVNPTENDSPTIWDRFPFSPILHWCNS